MSDGSRSSIYESGEYLKNNESWDIEDSPWKASHILRLIEKNELKVKTICEVGCGAGEILNQMYVTLPECHFVGYDISPFLKDFWKSRENENLKFFCQDFLKTDSYYDILMFIDLIEHLEDYFSFLRSIKNRGKYKIFNFPLELNSLAAMRSHPYLASRQKVGHLHYFNKEICLALLKELDFEVIDFFYASSSSIPKQRNMLQKLARLARISFASINEGLASRVLGGFSLFVLAK